VRALGRLPDSRAVNPLIQLLTDEHPPVRQAVIAALSRIGGVGAEAGLIQALADPTPANRLAAIRALAQRGDAAALKPLAGLVRDRAVVDGVTLGQAAGAARRAAAGRVGRR
jgi:HEAT repeat protein